MMTRRTEQACLSGLHGIGGGTLRHERFSVRAVTGGDIGIGGTPATRFNEPRADRRIGLSREDADESAA